ncbi:pyruvate kinase [Patescibacteria group bacterium]
MKVIATIPPYAPYVSKVLSHPLISGVRLNTVMPVKESLEELLLRLKKMAGKKDVWIDLKCRQIRTVHGSFFKTPTNIRTYELNGKTYILDPSNPRAYGELKTPPWAEIEISHKIKLDFSNGPVKCWMQDGYDSAYIAEVIDGDKLIMLDGPERVMGGGESINILDASLEIDGYLTELDREYIEAAKKVGIHTYMSSYIEKGSDINEILEIDPDAKITAKIESKKGVEWVRNNYSRYNDRVRLMAARGDLYVEMGRPDKVLAPLRTLIKYNPDAIVASRILTSLSVNPRPTCSDITDIACMFEMGYQHLMIGDDICFNEDVLFLALDILDAIGREYEY